MSGNAGFNFEGSTFHQSQVGDLRGATQHNGSPTPPAAGQPAADQPAAGRLGADHRLVPGEPVHRTILLFDIESSKQRDDHEKQSIHRTLYRAGDLVLEELGATEAEFVREDRGDGLFLLLDANLQKTRLLRVLLTALPDELDDRNRGLAPAARVRLRIAVHCGEVTSSLGGSIGTDVDEAFCLLDSDQLRRQLRENGDEASTALCVSETVHRAVVRHGYKGIPRDRFRPAAVRLGKRPTDPERTAWFHQPRR